MIVVWTPEAEQDRADIWDYIAADNPGAAGVKRFVTPRFVRFQTIVLYIFPKFTLQ
ncbi:type II toxin-antitoxin system RelE/ParE family toxin [Nitrosomonas europaea]|uniref:type II toxin-antitoxin system RelE/ParE family toxin n=1 Tax=Nitrosomonas europaea TaxID=915 RepID=UPI0032630FF4